MSTQGCDVIDVEELCKSVEVELSSKRQRVDGGEEDGEAAASEEEQEEPADLVAAPLPKAGTTLGGKDIDLSDASIHAFLELNFEAVGK